MVPSTVEQLAVLLLFVLPGTVYQAVLDRFRGPLAAERDLGNRVLRAIAASVVFDSVYAILFGPDLVALASGQTPLSGLAARPRDAGAAALLLLVVAPCVVAYLEAAYIRRKADTAYDVTPTSWDFLFKDRGSCWIRIRLKDTGNWVGGWYGTKSYASSFPHATDVYIESEYKMTSTGGFGTRVGETAGLYVAGANIELLELVEPTDSGGP